MGQSAVYLKKTIDFNKGFRQLLSVLKNLAVAEYHMLERRLKFFEELQQLAGEFFSAIDLNEVRHPFLISTGKPTAVLAVTSDAGLLGGINNQVITKALELVRSENGRLLVMGERGQVYAQDGGVPFTAFPGVVDGSRYQQASDMRDFLAKKVLGGVYGGIKVVYPRALSFVVHRVEVVTLVPFVRVETAASRASETQAPEPETKKAVIFESDPDDVVEYLVYLVMGQKLFEIFGMSRVCEQAARFLHLEESCNKIQEMNHKLLLAYFRRRHEIIDANMRELFSARTLYAK